MSKTIEIDKMAESIASMVIEWVDGGTKMGTDWRQGLASVIQLRLDRLAAPAVERQEEWAYCPECGCKDLHHEQGEHKQCANCYQEWFSDIDYSEVVRGNLEKLKASPPAPVAVQLDENVEFEKWWCRTPILRKGKLQIAQEAWEARARLDKVKEMNP